MYAPASMVLDQSYADMFMWGLYGFETYSLSLIGTAE